MFSRILLGTVSMAAGGILVSAAAAAGPDADVSVTASVPVPELTVAPPTDYRDVRLFNEYAFSGQAAFDPTNPRRLVVAIGVPGNPSKCDVRASVDGGKTWGAFVQLPQFAGGECQYLSAFQPAVTYAADGGRLYAAYAYIAGGSSGVAVSVSTDRGAPGLRR
jgi:hypothetical protein